MRIAFLVQRTPYYKVFAPVIEQALARKHRVFCFHDYSQPKTGKKAYQFPALNAMPRFKNGLAFGVPFTTEDELIKKVKEQNIEIIVSFDYFPIYQSLRDKLKTEGVVWIALQYGLDGVYTAECLLGPDKYFFQTLSWLEFVVDYLDFQGKNCDKKAMQSRAVFAGFPELDQSSIVNHYEVKKKWGIPEDKKVVLFLPFPFGSSNYWFWPKIIYGMHNPLLQLPAALLSFKQRLVKQVLKGENDKKVCSSLRNFCDRNNAFLLVKLRRKDPLKPYLAKMADKVVFDASYFPATIIECLSIADLCVNFVSTAVLEAVGMGVPNVCIMPSQKDYRHLQIPLWRILFEKSPDFFNKQGATYVVSIPQALKSFREKGFSDFPLVEAAQKEYIDKYIGISEPSKKIINELEKIAQIKYNKS